MQTMKKHFQSAWCSDGPVGLLFKVTTKLDQGVHLIMTFVICDVLEGA